MARKPKLGTGKRFAALRRSGMSPALAAHVGRKKYGAKKMSAMAAKGRKRAAARAAMRRRPGTRRR
jgi:hypothetical protein